MKRFYAGNEEYYHWMYIWSFAFLVLALFLMAKIYIYWKRRGGNEFYTPPPFEP